MNTSTLENFNPLLFLASLGAGGIAVSAFIFIQYGGIFSGEGLATLSQVPQTPIVLFLEAIMIVFTIIHIALSTKFFTHYFIWKKTHAYTETKQNPLMHSSLMAPIVSLAMSFNIIIAVLRYFIDFLSGNFQVIMAPAFVAYALLWIWGMFTAISLLKIAFIKTFDVDKIHFGWLLQPFSLAMITVTGTGFAALAKNTATITYNTDIAATAAFLAVVSGSMAVFLFSMQMVTIFKRHLHRDSILENTFVPTYLIVVPIITLFGVSIFRLGHYVDHLYTAPLLFTTAKLILFALFAFQVWYFTFGLTLLTDYWNTYLKNNHHVSQWGLICPFVGFVALGLFFFNLFFANAFFFYFLLAVFVFVIFLFFFLLRRHCACAKNKATVITCDK